MYPDFRHLLEDPYDRPEPRWRLATGPDWLLYLGAGLCLIAVLCFAATGAAGNALGVLFGVPGVAFGAGWLLGGEG